MGLKVAQNRFFTSSRFHVRYGMYSVMWLIIDEYHNNCIKFDVAIVILVPAGSVAFCISTPMLHCLLDEKEMNLEEAQVVSMRCSAQNVVRRRRFRSWIWLAYWLTATASTTVLLTTTIQTQAMATTSIITGANGYLGRAVIHELLSRDNHSKIFCLVRQQRISSEAEYWRQYTRATPKNENDRIQILPYDMLDGGSTLKLALQKAASSDESSVSLLHDENKIDVCVYHIASVFGPSEDHTQTALDNVKGTVDLVNTMAQATGDHGIICKLILTSSMAAVRGTDQLPLNGLYYTSEDWNTQSVLGISWGPSYQWSKTESERCAWKLCREYGIPMVSICPSFIFGPSGFFDNTQQKSTTSYSLTLVRQWVLGESPVQSRLFVDVRDAAQAHVEAAVRPIAVGKRYIVSTELRVPSSTIAFWLKDLCESTKLSDPKIIHHDVTFTSKPIPIGDKEVEATKQLQEELGITLRDVKDTITEMAHCFLNDHNYRCLEENEI